MNQRPASASGLLRKGETNENAGLVRLARHKADLGYGGRFKTSNGNSIGFGETRQCLTGETLGFFEDGLNRFFDVRIH